MKIIPNPEIPVPKSTTEPVSSYAFLAMLALDFPPQGGFLPADQRARNRVAAVLEKAGDKIELEDADFETLKKCVAVCPFNVRSIHIEAFYAALGL